MTNLDELERLYAAATKGRWIHDPDWRHDGASQILQETNTNLAVAFLATGMDKDEHEATADLIVALHNFFPALAAELRALREFAADMFDASDWPDGGDVDGFEFQELATKHGLLRPEQRTEPCGEDCQCCEVHSEEDMKDGFTCLRKAEWLQSVERARMNKETS